MTFELQIVKHFFLAKVLSLRVGGGGGDGEEIFVWGCCLEDYDLRSEKARERVSSLTWALNENLIAKLAIVVVESEVEWSGVSGVFERLRI